MGKVVLRTRQECEDFVRGLCFMGAGGGGRPERGLKLLLDQLEAGREIEWVDVDSLPDEAWTATVAGMGGRGGAGVTQEELAELGCVEEKYGPLGLMVAAVQALEEAAGIKVEAIVPGEIGGSNVPAPIVAALELGLSVVDGDYAGGRAIPELPQTIAEIRGVPVSPLSFVTRWGDVMILKDTISTAMADRIGRMMCVAAYGGVGVSWYLLPIKDVKEVLATGTLTQALQVGQAIREARQKGADPVAAAVKAVDGWLLFEGELTATEIADEESYAFGLGSHTLKGLGSHQGHTFRIWYKNEYHLSWMDGRPFVTSPDSLIMVDLKTGEPATSYDFSVGDHVAVVGRKAHPAHRTEKGIELLGPRHFGFDLDYVPIEERVKARFDLEKLLMDVFAPQPGEKVLVMSDLPHGEWADNKKWADRREMAKEWHAAFQQLGIKLGFSVHPPLTYLATGAHSAPLPEEGEMEGRQVRLEDILSDTNIAVALTEYSATAPLIGFSQKLPDLRAASMPGVTKSMEQTALAADYSEVARKSHVLVGKLNQAVDAKVEFSTGHQLYFDLRYRQAEADDGQLHADRKGVRLINLPSGEAFIAPYEGEVQGHPSRTKGMIPVMVDDELILFRVQENRIVEVIGDGPQAAQKRDYFAVDEARCNIAELGLGCNDKAVISGTILEDEKVLGMHWAYGRSDHIGGTVGVTDFSDPSHVVHHDIVYPKGGRIEIASLVLKYEDGTSEEIIKNGQYTIF